MYWQNHTSAYMKKFTDLIKNGKIATSIKFKLMDVVEQKENNWVLYKRRDEQISTIDQVGDIFIGSSHLPTN